MSNLSDNMRELLQAANWRLDGAEDGGDAGLVDTLTRWVPMEEDGEALGEMFNALNWLKTHADPSIEEANETIKDPVASGKVREGTWRYTPRRAYLDREGDKKKIGLYQSFTRDGGAGASGEGVEVGSMEDFSKRRDWTTDKGQAAEDSQVAQPLVQGQIDTKTAEQDPKTGLWANKIESLKPKDQVIEATEVSPSGITATVSHTEATAALSAPGVTPGHILTNKNKPTDAGNNETTAVDENPTDQEADSKEISPSGVTDTHTHTELPVAAVGGLIPTSTPGQIKALQVRPTKAGNAQTALSVEQPTDQTGTGIEVSLTSISNTTLHTERAIADIPAAPTSAQGYIKTLDADPTKAGNARTVEKIVQSVKVDSGTVNVGGSATNTETEVVTVNSRTPLTAAAGAQGIVTRAGNSINADGTYSGKVTADQSVEVTSGAVAAGGSKTSVETEVVTVNSRTPLTAVAGAQGIVNRVSNSINQDGTYSGKVATAQSVPTTTGTVAVGGTATKTEAEVVSVNSTTPATTAPGGVGITKHASNRINPDGTFDTAVGTSTAVSKTVTVVSGTQTQSESSKVTINATAAASPGVGAQGKTTRARNRFNPDGTLDTDEDTITASPVDTGAKTSMATAFATAKTTQFKNQTTPVEATAQAVGSTSHASNSINTDKTYDASLTDVQANEVSETIRTSESSDRFTEIVDRVHNAASIPDATDTANASVVVEGGMNDFRKYDYTKKTRTARIPQSCQGVVDFTVLGEYYNVEFYSTTTPPLPYRFYTWHSGTSTYQRSAIHSISFYQTAAEAAAVATGGWEGSGISQAGEWLWMARKVVRNDVFKSSVSYTDPGTRIPNGA